MQNLLSKLSSLFKAEKSKEKTLLMMELGLAVFLILFLVILLKIFL